MNKQYKRKSECREIERLFQALIRTTPLMFPHSGERLDAPSQRGVYIIYAPAGGVAHVGSTPWAKNGLAQRLRDHLQGKSSFTLKKFNGEGYRLRGKFKYSYLVVEDGRQRALLEALAIGHLCPEHIGHGLDKAE